MTSINSPLSAETGSVKKKNTSVTHDFTDVIIHFVSNSSNVTQFSCLCCSISAMSVVKEPLALRTTKATFLTWLYHLVGWWLLIKSLIGPVCLILHSQAHDMLLLVLFYLTEELYFTINSKNQKQLWANRDLQCNTSSNMTGCKSLNNISVQQLQKNHATFTFPLHCIIASNLIKEVKAINSICWFFLLINKILIWKFVLLNGSSKICYHIFFLL